jgi:NAD(P)-dependent dehydrogenase (short-subunit alcohol dehydrogenase family)
MDLKISGRTAVLSGAAGDMALETAKLLEAEGCNLVLTDIDGEELEEAAGKLDGNPVTVVADLSGQDGADKVRDAVEAQGWHADILVHAAGVTGAKGDPLEDISEDDWMHAWTTDFMSAVRMSRTFIPGMNRRGWGRVVFVTSENVAQPYPDEVVYNCSKSAVLSFAKGMSQVYAPKGTLINCVAPAFIETDMTDMMMDKSAEEEGISREEMIEKFLRTDRPHLVLNRRGKPDEVAFVIACLCSERASFVVGSNWRVDGGSVQAINI